MVPLGSYDNNPSHYFLSILILFSLFPSCDSGREGGGVLLQMRKWVSLWQLPDVPGLSDSILTFVADALACPLPVLSC